MPIRLLIVDDHVLVREGLRLSFAGTDVQVVAEAVNGEAAFAELMRHAIDVALVDVRMPGSDGFRLLELVRQAGLKLPVALMHTVNDGSENVRRSRSLGAVGLLPKGLGRDELIGAIRQVHAGESLWEMWESEPSSMSRVETICQSGCLPNGA
ncbi:MAG: response regulator transcription factor [Planctomycetaceae bacterium]|nr:response regulator transcription factor [Planctomycetaceae bacterium]